MSWDFVFWYPHKRLNHAQSQDLYDRITAGKAEDWPPHESIESFYKELSQACPDIEMEHSPSWIICSCRPAKTIAPFEKTALPMAHKYGLAAYYNPQDAIIKYADDKPSEMEKFRKKYPKLAFLSAFLPFIIFLVTLPWLAK